MYTPLLQSSGALQATGVQWVSSTSTGELTGGTDATTFSHTVPAGDNRLLLVSVHTRAGINEVIPQSVTYGGVPLTLITSGINYNVFNPPPAAVSFWYLLAPAVGTANIVVTWPPAGVTRRAISATNLVNVNQSKPIEAFASSSGLGTTVSTSITTLTGTSMLVDGVYHLDGPWTIGQEQFLISTSFGTDGQATSYKPAPTIGGPTTMYWLNAVSQQWCHVIVAIASTDSQFSGTIRPSQDILTTGWTAARTLYLDSDIIYLGNTPVALSTDATTGDEDLYDMINEASAVDGDYILSPSLTDTPPPAIFNLEKELPAELYNLRVRARRTVTGYGSIRLVLQNRYGDAVGTSSWQPLSDSFTTYTFQLNTTGPATRAMIETGLFPFLTGNFSSNGSSIALATGQNSPTVTPSLVVEYVDTSGTRQTTTVANDGSTTISGVAPFLVHFDASGSRSTSVTTLEDAWHNLGYRLNYGESLGGTWTYGGGSKDEDTGPPVFGRVFTTTGTKLVRLRVRDSIGNESTIQLNVVVSAAPAATNILSPSQGGTSWPAFTSGTHYTLNRGQDYTSFGTINTNGLHNVLFSATGSGAFPIISTLNFDSRGNNQDTVVTRARNIRTFNVDVVFATCGAVGFDYCGIVQGRCRSFEPAPATYNYIVATTPTRRSNVKYYRGLFLWDAGEMNPSALTSTYVMIHGGRRLHVVGMDLHHNQPGYEHIIRNCHEQATYRHSRMYSTYLHKTHLKLQGGDANRATNLVDAWPLNSDLVGDPNAAFGDPNTVNALGLYGYPSYMTVFNRVQFGASSSIGAVLPEYMVTIAPENNDAINLPSVPYQAHDLIAVEDCVGFEPTAGQTLNPNSVAIGGKNISVRNFRMNLGAGSSVQYGLGLGTGQNAGRLPPGYAGPYILQDTNTRPIPSTF